MTMKKIEKKKMTKAKTTSTHADVVMHMVIVENEKLIVFQFLFFWLLFANVLRYFLVSLTMIMISVLLRNSFFLF